jgi:general secretion pathway protein F
MPRYRVRVFTPPSGDLLRELDAPDRQALPALLGVLPQYVLGASIVEAPGATRSPVGRGRFPLQLFSQELAVLLEAGIALLEALQTLREKEPQAIVRAALDEVIEALSHGQSLSAAMRAQPRAFDELICAIVAANERTGQLATALAQHARYLAWVEGLRSRLVAAFIYPTMLLAVGSAVILFLLLYVLPRFSGILDGLQGDLPWASRVLLEFGRFAGAHPAWLLGGVVGVTLGASFLSRHAPLQARCRAALWQLPGLGPRLRVLALARLYRSLAMLLGAGVPVLSALRIVQAVVPLPWRVAVHEAAEKVARGERFSEAMEAQQLVTPVARRMVRVGERSGELPAMLEKAASFHDEEVVRLSELLTRAINPALMLIMGVMIGGIIVLMYLPIFQLVEQVQ